MGDKRFRGRVVVPTPVARERNPITPDARHAERQTLTLQQRLGNDPRSN